MISLYGPQLDRRRCEGFWCHPSQNTSIREGPAHSPKSKRFYAWTWMHGSNDQRILMERWSFQQATVLCFVEFALVFDSVDGDSLWQMMAADGMPQKLLGLIKAYCSSTKMKVRANGSDSMAFEIRSGVQQGCALSSTDFNYIIHWILGQTLQDNSRVQVGAKGQRLSGRSALNFALRLRDMACTSSRRKDVGGI